jgi:hypothetical protein
MVTGCCASREKPRTTTGANDKSPTPNSKLSKPKDVIQND